MDVKLVDVEIKQEPLDNDVDTATDPFAVDPLWIPKQEFKREELILEDDFLGEEEEEEEESGCSSLYPVNPTAMDANKKMEEKQISFLLDYSVGGICFDHRRKTCQSVESNDDCSSGDCRSEINVDAAESSQTWPLSEELKLLEVMCVCGADNWDDVSKYFTNRSAEQCKAYYYNNFIYSPKLTELKELLIQSRINFENHCNSYCSWLLAPNIQSVDGDLTSPETLLKTCNSKTHLEPGCSKFLELDDEGVDNTHLCTKGSKNRPVTFTLEKDTEDDCSLFDRLCSQQDPSFVRIKSNGMGRHNHTTIDDGQMEPLDEDETVIIEEDKVDQKSEIQITPVNMLTDNGSSKAKLEILDEKDNLQSNYVLQMMDRCDKFHLSDDDDDDDDEDIYSQEKHDDKVTMTYSVKKALGKSPQLEKCSSSVNCRDYLQDFIDKTKLIKLENNLHPNQQQHTKKLDLFERIAGYNTVRSEFDVEYNNRAEEALMRLQNDILLESEGGDDLMSELALAVVRNYNHCLAERARRKLMVHKFGLLDPLKAYASRKKCESVFGRQGAKHIIRLKQLMTLEEFDDLLNNIQRSNDLKVQLNKLIRCREKGLTTIRGIELYEDMKKLRNVSRKRLQALPQIRLLDSGGCVVGGPLRRPAPPISVVNMSGYEILDSEETAFCSVNRIVPDSYIQYRDMLVNECKRKNGLKLAQARPLLKIDVNKTRKLFDFLLEKKLLWKSASVS